MSLAIVYTRALFGMEAPLVAVEVHLSPGTAGFSIVGLPETAVKESRDRVRSALLNTHFEFPVRKIIVNLAPADLPKEGGRFDLAIAVGILVASGQLPEGTLTQYEFLGELALSGELRAVNGVLPAALAAQKEGRCLVLPLQNQQEAGLLDAAENRAAKHLLEVCAFLNNENQLPVCETKLHDIECISDDLAEVKGQDQAKRALEIAAAGRHSLLFSGPPGTGKTMLATRLPSLLPPLDKRTALEVAALASISRYGFDLHCWQKIPFRAPHHTSSSAALVGGGRPPRPGEISLAHHGVLFMDELPEYPRQVLECLREPLESGHITISRAAFSATFPAKFQLIAAMNPCPCGYAGSKQHECRCSLEQVSRYMNKLSGPLLDRIDMQVELTPALPDFFSKDAVSQNNNTSRTVRDRVLNARKKQYARQKKCNADLTVKEIDTELIIKDNAKTFLCQVMQRLRLSARVYHRVIRVARTIADLAKEEAIKQDHIAEAISYRRLDRFGS